MVVKNLIPHYSSIFITRKLFFYGVLTALPLLAFQAEPYHLATLFDLSQPKSTPQLPFLVAVCSCAAFMVWNLVINTLEHGNGQQLPLHPASRNDDSRIRHTWREHLSYVGYIGCVLIIGGLILSDKWNPQFGSKRLKKE